MFKLIALVFIASVMAVVVVPQVDGSTPRGDRAAADAQTAARRRVCDRNYSGRCLRPNVSDYDCAGGSGNGPYYVRGPFRVIGSDHYGLDSDGDGTACE